MPITPQNRVNMRRRAAQAMPAMSAMMDQWKQSIKDNGIGSPPAFRDPGMRANSMTGMKKGGSVEHKGRGTGCAMRGGGKVGKSCR